jgi:hypothetical protein
VAACSLVLRGYGAVSGSELACANCAGSLGTTNVRGASRVVQFWANSAVQLSSTEGAAIAGMSDFTATTWVRWRYDGGFSAGRPAVGAYMNLLSSDPTAGSGLSGSGGGWSFVCGRHSDGTWYLQLRLNGNRGECDATFTTNISVANSVFYHYGVSFSSSGNSNVANFFVDGVKVGSIKLASLLPNITTVFANSFIPPSLPYLTLPYQVGANVAAADPACATLYSSTSVGWFLGGQALDSNVNQFRGRLDDVRIYDSVLADDAFLQLKNSRETSAAVATPTVFFPFECAAVNCVSETK